MQSFFKKTQLEVFDQYCFNHYSYYNASFEFEDIESSDNRILTIFKGMYQRYLDNGGAHIRGTLNIDGAILLENDNEVIAAIFYDLQRSVSNIYILLAFTEPNHRMKGIYKKLHSLIDIVGKDHGRVGVTSFIGVHDQVMLNTIAKNIGYTHLYQVVYRPIKS
jgi:hypothetical protein